MASALIIRKPWIDLIVDGLKTWEMRSRLTNKKGTILLIQGGSGLVIGQCKLLGAAVVSKADFNDNKEKHRISDQSLLDRWPVAWMLSDAKRFNPENVIYAITGSVGMYVSSWIFFGFLHLAQ